MLAANIAAGFNAAGRDMKALAAAGQIAYFAGQHPPAGWLRANGAALPRAHYAELFGLLGSAFGGGDGVNTFNLPAVPAPAGLMACIRAGGQAVQSPRSATVHAFQPSTGEYLGARQADISPNEPGDVVLLPPFCTIATPPAAGANQAAVFEGGQWRLVPDYRTSRIWSTATAVKVTAQLGQSLADLGATDQPPPFFSVWDGQAWQVDQAAKNAADAVAAQPEFRYLDDSTRRNALIQQAQQDARQMLLLAYAARKPLEVVALAGSATQAELDLLAAWKRYCNALAKIAQQPGYPASIVWPAPPA
ncbi:tail fiber protein [Chromobacterium haemolyticum]|uniref:tail fiber protein n=1 Tax=Chromobacterium haemolyticum TaxID=394935 RepID=UPI0009DAB224|nr:tail fiber protein [Chromobacterium haemolyticum]